MHAPQTSIGMNTDLSSLIYRCKRAALVAGSSVPGGALAARGTCLTDPHERLELASGEPAARQADYGVKSDNQVGPRL